jgi:hypothetical protein
MLHLENAPAGVIDIVLVHRDGRGESYDRHFSILPTRRLARTHP